MKNHPDAFSFSLQLEYASGVGAVEQRRDASQTVPLYRIPFWATVDDHAVICGSEFLPFRDESFEDVDTHSILAFTIDEARLLDECFRVIRPGGKVTGMVPNKKGFGHIDATNLARYVADVVKKGPRLPELLESGWRKHYSTNEVIDLLQGAGFDVVSVATMGMLAGEASRSVNVVERWLDGRGRSPHAADETPLRKSAMSRLIEGSSIVFEARRS